MSCQHVNTFVTKTPLFDQKPPLLGRFGQPVFLDLKLPPDLKRSLVWHVV